MSFEDMINTIQLGDCYELIKSIPDNSIDCVYIDVPYLYDNGGGGTSELAKRIIKRDDELNGKTQQDKIKERIENLIDKMNNAKDDYEREKYRKAMNIERSRLNLEVGNIISGIDYSIFDELCRVMKKTNIFIWCSKLQILDILNYFDKDNVRFEILTWNKTNPTPACNGTWLPDIEYCLYFREKGVILNEGYELKRKWFISPINKSDKDLYNHPTIKPLDLVKRHLLHTTQPNDVILDCFCGSGTTCVASKEIGRRFIGMEVNEEYHKIACDRLNGINANGQMSLMFDYTE